MMDNNMDKVYPTDNFLNAIYRKKANFQPLYKVSKEQLIDVIVDKKKKLVQVLKLDELEQIAENVYTEMKSERRDHYRCTEYEMTFLSDLTAPVWMLTPDRKNGKTILYCHGHDSYGAQGSFEHYGDKNPYHKWLPLELVKRGYTVVIPEFVGFGSVIKEHFKERDQRFCYANSTTLLNLGLNMAGLRVFQTKQLFQHMYKQWGMKEIVAYGVSGGGLVCTFFGAIESRLKGVVISNYGATFASSTMAMHHCVDNYIPDILSVGECSDIMALATPTPMLLSNGIHDPIFPLEGVKETIEQVQKVYDMLDHSEKFHFELFDGVHEISLDQVFSFLEEVF